MPHSTNQFRAYIDPHLYDACRREFARLGTTQTKVINMLLAEWLQRTKPEDKPPQPSSAAKPKPVAPAQLAGQPKRRKDIGLNAALYEEMERRAKSEGLPVSTWVANLIQTALMADPVLSHKELLAFEQQIREVSAIGRNLNQIARHLNTDYVKGEPPDITKLKVELLEDIQREIQSIQSASYALVRARRKAWGVSDERD